MCTVLQRRPCRLTPKDKVESRQDPYLVHHPSQTLRNHTQAHTNDQEQEEAQRVPSGIEDRDDEKESEGRGASTLFVDVPVIGEIGQHLDDEEDDRAGDVVLHGSGQGRRVSRGLDPMDKRHVQ